LQAAASVVGMSSTVWTSLGKFVREEMYVLSISLLLRVTCSVDLLQLMLAMV